MSTIQNCPHTTVQDKITIQGDSIILSFYWSNCPPLGGFEDSREEIRFSSSWSWKI